MNTEQETNTRVEESELNLGDILQTVLANWYWFVLSVVVCAGAAFLYLKWAPKVYTRGAPGGGAVHSEYDQCQII